MFMFLHGDTYAAVNRNRLRVAPGSDFTDIVDIQQWAETGLHTWEHARWSPALNERFVDYIIRKKKIVALSQGFPWDPVSDL